MVEVTEPAERVAKAFYKAYPHQLAFHQSRARHRLLGGAAGPGKTYALLMDHYLRCNQFSPDLAPEVHTLIVRRTYPKLESTVLTRFREKFPPELYRDFNESKAIVTWKNGSTTKFGAMQYEHDVWGYQGQWYKIAYDELTEFTFGQWQNISAWNRCPVSVKATKDGATNPIGIGARWVEDLFVKHQACAEMDQNQREQYDPAQYAYFPATYLDNPIYAHDSQYIAGLDSYQKTVSEALKLGKWGVAGGYFDGAWDEAYNVYPADSVKIAPWWRRWLGGDWGFEHNSAIYWLSTDELGIVRCYRELVCNKHTPEELGERIAKLSEPDRDGDGNLGYERFTFAHDAHARRTDANTIAIRMGKVLEKHGFPPVDCSTKDKKGREQIIYDLLKRRVKTGETFNDATGNAEPVLVAKLQIADCCPQLIRILPTAPRDEDKPEEIAEFLGDDPIPGLGYPLYAMFRDAPADKPFDMRVNERVAQLVDRSPRTPSITEQMIARKRVAQEERQKGPRPIPIRRHWRFHRQRPPFLS